MTEYNRNLTDYITKQVELEDIFFKDISFKKQETRKKLKSIEFQLGRKKKSENGVYQSRLIDIDILLYDDTIMTIENLTIPHERYHQRMFVLKPLSQIAANFRDPVQCKTIKQLFTECIDQSAIHLYGH